MSRQSVLRSFLALAMGLSLAWPANAVPKPPVNAPGVLDWSTLSLSTDQIRRINLLRLEFQRTAIKLRADIELRRVEIDRMMVSPSADPNRLRQLLREKTEFQTKLEFASLENFLAIKALLSAKQLERLPEARLMSTP